MSQKKVGKYKIGKTLGEGTFGKVKYAVHDETNEAVAIKVLDKEKIQQQNMGQQIKKEISIMKVVRHPNIVQLREVLASRTKIFIVLELVTGGELFDQIVKEGRFLENKARKYFRQLIYGLEYCNSRGVCHRDLKPENLLLDGNADLKISDFGLSALYTGGDGDGSDGSNSSSRTTLLHTTCGTPNYVAPEVLQDKGYDGRKADLWSCGVILYVLLAGFLPFDEPTMPALFTKIQNADFQYPKWFSPEVRQMLNTILTVDPKIRADIKAIKSNEWFNDNNKLEEGDLMLGSGGAGEEGLAFKAAKKEFADMNLSNSEKEKLDLVEGGINIGDTKDKNDTNDDTNDSNDDNKLTSKQSVSNDIAQSTMTKTQSEARVKRVFQFKTRGASSSIIAALSSALTSMECELKLFEDNLKIKACRMTSKGMIGVVLQVYNLEGDLFMVEVRRGKGDIMEYSKFYTGLVKDKIAHLIEEIVEAEVDVNVSANASVSSNSAVSASAADDVSESAVPTVSVLEGTGEAEAEGEKAGGA